MNAAPQPPQDQPTRPRREEPSRSPQSRRAGRILLHILGWAFYVILVLIGCLAWYANTASFKRSVRNAVVAELEKSTGGRVDLQRFNWRLTHLEFEADNLTIHGLEAPGQVPYAHIDRLFVRLQILSFFRAKIGLNHLEADHPVIHLIVYPDGTTNQPKPKHPSTGDTKDEIFNLAIGRTVIDNGVVILNDRKIPFNLSANNLAAQVSYVPLRDHYTGTFHAEDIVVQRGTDTPVHSVLDAALDVGRNTANLLSLTLQSGPAGKAQKTIVRINGTLNNFSSPSWQFSVKGAVDALEVRALTGLPGLEAGTAQLDATGHGTNTQFLIDGTARLSGAAYRTGTVHVTNLTADAVAHLTQDQIAVTNIHARLATGGALTGDMRIDNWNAPPSAQPGQRAPSTAPEKGAIHAHLAGFSLDSIMATSAPSRYRHLGFDTAASGTANVAWTGSVSNLTGAVDVQLTPPHPPSPNEVPVSGTVNAEYLNRSGTVVIHAFDIHTPASQIQIAGSLGVYPMSRPSALNVSLSTRDLSEFNPALTAFGLSAHGQGSPVPAQLRGVADFHGAVSGSLNIPTSAATSRPLTSTLHDRPLPPLLLASAASSSTASPPMPLTPPALFPSPLPLSSRAKPQFSSPAKSAAAGNPPKTYSPTRPPSAPPFRSPTPISPSGSPLPEKTSLSPVPSTCTPRPGGTIGDLDGAGYLILAGGSSRASPTTCSPPTSPSKATTLNASHLVFTLDGGSVRGSAGYDLASKGSASPSRAAALNSAIFVSCKTAISCQRLVFLPGPRQRHNSRTLPCRSARTSATCAPPANSLASSIWMPTPRTTHWYRT